MTESQRIADLERELQRANDRILRLKRPRCADHFDDLPDPCPYCGAKVATDACRDMSDESHLHERIQILEAENAALRERRALRTRLAVRRYAYLVAKHRDEMAEAQTENAVLRERVAALEAGREVQLSRRPG